MLWEVGEGRHALHVALDKPRRLHRSGDIFAGPSRLESMGTCTERGEPRCGAGKHINKGMKARKHEMLAGPSRQRTAGGCRVSKGGKCLLEKLVWYRLLPNRYSSNSLLSSGNQHESRQRATTDTATPHVHGSRSPSEANANVSQKSGC